MKHMKKITKLFVGVFCALLLATSAFAADTNAGSPESWVFTLAGTGATTTTTDSQSAFGVDLSIGRTGHLLLPIEAGVRQGVAYASGDGGSAVLDTSLYSDWTLLTIKKVDLFAGGNIGLAYGNTPLSWTVAPEAGVRVWIKKNVALVGRLEYPFDINDGRAENTLRYVLGLAAKF